MSRLIKFKVLTFTLFLAVAVSYGSQATLNIGPAERIPVESFFAEADIRSLQISPDGKYVAFLTTLGTGKVGIVLMEVASGKMDPLVAAKDENIKSYFWKGNDYIVYAGDIGGNENSAYRSISISKRKVIVLAESFREVYSENANFAQLIDPLKFDSNHILAYGPREVGSYNFRIWKIDVRNGERLASNDSDEKPDTGDYAVDTKGLIRARSRLEGKRILFEIRPTEKSLFTKVADFPIENPQWVFHQFAADDETLYLTTTDQSNTPTLHSLNVRTKEFSPPLFNVPDGEIGGVLMSWDRTKLYGVSYQTDKNHYHFFDPNRAQLQKQLDATLPGTENFIVSSTPDEKLLVVAATSDRDPGTYYLLDLRTPRLMPIGKISHLINPAMMRPMEPIQYTARDGLTIHGYLTRPAGSDGKVVPLIVNPHGGPYGIRDEWGFNGEVQFLANRGFAVLQINYRGSGGYGDAFMKAGQKEWGGKMQNDLSDGVKWAIEQGITDARHVGIYGASYGGYAALAGVTFTPELYRCAINYVGVSDLGIITGWGTRFGRGSDLFYREWVGDDRDYKFNRSPLNFVEKIRVPTLHAYGFNDPRVDIKHWTRLEPKLKQYGKTYEIMIMGNEGHGFRNESNRIAFYRRMEAFLDKYMWDGPVGHVDLKELQILEMPAKEKTP